MGDCAYGIAACFRAYGQSAEVMPIADEDTLMRGRQFTTGKECLPCAITAGDMLSVLKKTQPSKAAFFMPGGIGPCRFGMYNCMHRLVLKYAGAEELLIISPNQDGNFYRDFVRSFNGSAHGNFIKDVWIAAVGIDLLSKLIMRIRPFAKDAAKAQRIYQQAMDKWIRGVENNTSLSHKCGADGGDC